MRNLIRWKLSPVMGVVLGIVAFVFTRHALVYNACASSDPQSRQACIERNVHNSFDTWELPALAALGAIVVGFFLVYGLSCIGEGTKPEPQHKAEAGPSEPSA